MSRGVQRQQDCSVPKKFYVLSLLCSFQSCTTATASLSLTLFEPKLFQLHPFLNPPCFLPIFSQQPPSLLLHPAPLLCPLTLQQLLLFYVEFTNSCQCYYLYIIIIRMLIFYFLFLDILFSPVLSQSYISAINKTFPFRLGSGTAYTFMSSNNYIMNLSPELTFVPTTTMVAMHSYDNLITSGASDLKITIDYYSFSTTGFRISCDITRPSGYERIGFSYAIANPSWNVWYFYSTGMTSSSSKAITTSMIGNQPLSNIQGITIKALGINYTAINAVPYYFNVYFNGSSVIMETTGEIAAIEFDVSILTMNTSTVTNQAYGMTWGTTGYSILSGTYGTRKDLPLNDTMSSINFINGLVSAKWNDKNHLSFRFEQRVTSMNLSFIWMSNSSYVKYDFFTMYFIIENCTNPSYPYMVYQIQRCYSSCPSDYYTDSATMRCKTCLIPNCTKCTSGSVCEVCSTLYVFKIEAGNCVECNPDPLNTTSTLPLCVAVTPDPEPQPQPQPQPEPQPEPEPQNDTTVFSCNLIRNGTVCAPFNNSMDFAIALTTVVSIPTISLLTSALTQLIGLFDDFSYYLYHNRVYSRLVIIYFQMASNFTLDRFYPTQLQSTMSKIDFSYTDNILPNDLGKSPPKFKELDTDIYFLKNMQDFFVGTLLFAFIVFAIMALINYLTNKCFKHKILKRYNYFGMFFVSVLASNVQYISFRCFQQLYLTVPISGMHYLNLIVCYTLLFLVFMFSIGGITVFKVIYKQVKSEYVSQQLFQSSFDNWFIISNLLKMLNGFIHAYFYYQSLLQEGLLAASFALKAFIYLFLIYRMEEKLTFIFDTISNFLMLVFQSLIFAELFLITKGEYTTAVENNMGEIEFSILIVIFVTSIMAAIVIPIKTLIVVFQGYFCYHTPKIDMKDIRIVGPCYKKVMECSTLRIHTKKVIEYNIRKQLTDGTNTQREEEKKESKEKIKLNEVKKPKRVPGGRRNKLNDTSKKSDDSHNIINFLSDRNKPSQEPSKREINSKHSFQGFNDLSSKRQKEETTKKGASVLSLEQNIGTRPRIRKQNQKLAFKLMDQEAFIVGSDPESNM